MKMGTSCNFIFICTWERADSCPNSRNQIVGLQSTGIKYEPLMCRRILSLVPSTLLIPLQFCDKSPSHWQSTDKEHHVIWWWLRRFTVANVAESGCSSNPLLPTCRAVKAGEQPTRAAGTVTLTALTASACCHPLFPKAMGSVWPVTRQVYFW